MAKKVFLSAGHGGKDPGAVGNGLKEKDVNLQMLLACKAELERHGITVVASRTKDENDPVGDEVLEANRSGADLAVSFHNNAGGGDGFEGFYWASDGNGKKLVQIAQKYINAMGQNNHGNPVKTGNHLYFVSTTKMTAVLFETFFLDSKDYLIGDTVEEQKAFGVAYAKAILEYFGIKWTAPNQTTSNTGSPQNGGSGTGFLVRVLVDLNIRKTPSWGNNVVGVAKPNVYTIVETKTVEGVLMGRLKSGAGWISLHSNYVKRV